MRICLVSPYDLSLEGGVNKHVFYLAESLRANGDHVEVIGPASGEMPDQPSVTTFGGVVSIQQNDSDNRIGLLTSPLAVRAYMRSRSFDVIHIHEPLTPSLPYYALFQCNAKARIATFHRYSEHEGMIRFGRKLLAPMLRYFDRGIAVSAAAARYASYAWPRPLSIIPNGVDTKFFRPGRRDAERRDDGTTRLLFVGQWTDKRKGLPVLMEAYARLRARGINVALDVVGQGDPKVPQPAGLHGLTFHGRVSEQQLRRRFHECDIFVAPSTGSESFGIVLAEGMASGKPVVCSDIEGYRQVVSRDGARLAPPHDSHALAEILLNLCRDRDLRRAMGSHNLVEARKYDWATVSPQVREEYELAIATPPSGRTRTGQGWQVYRAPVAEQSAEIAAPQVAEIERPGRVASAK
jgi:phosphatidylinositol alpha-mannosyltransferase